MKRRKIKRAVRRAKKAARRVKSTARKAWNDPATQTYIKKQKKLLKDTLRATLRRIERDIDKKLR